MCGNLNVYNVLIVYGRYRFCFYSLQKRNGNPNVISRPMISVNVNTLKSNLNYLSISKFHPEIKTNFNKIPFMIQDNNLNAIR